MEGLVLLQMYGSVLLLGAESMLTETLLAGTRRGITVFFNVQRVRLLR